MENLIPPLPSPQMPVLPGKKSLIIKIILMAVIVMFLGGSAVFGYFFYQKQQQKVKNATTENRQISIATDPDNSFIPPTSTPGNAPASTPSSAENTFSCKNPGPVMASRSGLVLWQNGQYAGELTLFAANASSPDYTEGVGYVDDSSVIVGHFISGKYQDSDLLITTISVQYDWPGGDLPQFMYIVRQGNKYTILGKYSDSLPSDIKGKVSFTIDKDFDLPDLDMPAILHFANPKADLSLANSLGAFRNRLIDFCADGLIKVFTDPVVGDVYTDPADTQNQIFTHGFYVKAPDGTKATYELEVSFVGADHIPLVSWANGQKNNQDYSYQFIGGCGASRFLDVQDVTPQDLTQIGTTSDGQLIYGYKDSNASELKTMYDEIYIPDDQAKPPYSAFVGEHPIFFWQDPFGQFVRFKIMKYQPLAECAKPVIYLYPQQQEEVNVQLAPVGGFTYTEPAYQNGWNVLANPNGQLINLSNNKVYPYLFWEGRGGMYQSPNKGFVVAQKNVHQFLTDKLHQLGLNDKETADFQEYWEPKMQGSPYYFVSFYGNTVMDQLAPLSVTPKPDTVIRILMDYKPLQQPITVDGFNIHTPVRKGFTVVEWGGVLK